MFRNIAIRGSYINREFCHVFLAKNEQALSGCRLQDGEVVGVYEVGIQDAVNLFSKKVPAVKAAGISRCGNQYTTEEKIIRIEDTCNWRERCEVSNYYLNVMLACRGFLRGDEIVRF